MKTMLLTLAAWLAALFVALSEAHACTVAPDNLTGGYWIQYYQGGAGGSLTQWGDWLTPALQVQVINKGCNDLQSYGSVSGNMYWFGALTAPTVPLGDGTHGYYVCGWGYAICSYNDRSLWVNPNEGAVFYWKDTQQWNRGVNCAPTGNWYWVGNAARAQWSCTHQQSRDLGITWGGTSTMLLNPAL